MIFVANHIEVDGQHSTGLIKGVNLGTLSPGMMTCKSLLLVASGPVGDRMIDFSIQSCSLQNDNQDHGDEATPSVQDKCELLQTLIIPTAAPFNVKHEVTYSRRGTVQYEGVSKMHGSNFWDSHESSNAVVTTILECTDCFGAGNITLDRIELSSKVSSSTILDSWR